MKISIIGHSHIKCMEAAYRASRAAAGAEFGFLQLHQFKSGHMAGALNLSVQNIVKSDLVSATRAAVQGAQLAVLCPTGNAPTIFGLRGKGREAGGRFLVSEKTTTQLGAYLDAYGDWLAVLQETLDVPMIVVPSPPPVGNNDWIMENPGIFEDALQQNGASPPAYRLQVYELWCQGIRGHCSRLGLRFAGLPPEVFTADGFLQECFYDVEPSHANAAYGALVLKYVAGLAGGQESAQPPAAGAAAPARAERKSHPYVALPDSSFWKQSVSRVAARDFDPVTEVPFRITRTDAVATAGSCFAQHISKRLRSGGFRFLATEKAQDAAAVEGAAPGYDFSARYGNIYTARQLLQLFDRAYGYFSPRESHWALPGGRFCDPFRPQIEPDGFTSVEALVADRERHFAAVREMFEQLDIFVFTLGLTETWVSRLDGAVYPVAPGVAGGEFDPARYAFVNFGVAEVQRDLETFIGKLRLVNPKARLILTVSPVPLVATYTDRNVLVATTYSKSVLRVVAETVSRSVGDVQYFPSFEIITGNYNRGRYFGPDLRAVTEEGVDHVMSVFMRHLTDADPEAAAPADAEADAGTGEMMALAEAACDEELLARK
jgi:hypothetical protein